jgi:hypothetical protein
MWLEGGATKPEKIPSLKQRLADLKLLKRLDQQRNYVKSFGFKLTKLSIETAMLHLTQDL